MNHKTDLKYAGLPERVCRECGAPYPAHTDFFRIQKGKYMDRVCRKCVLVRQLAWSRNNLERRREACRRWRRDNLEKSRQLQRESWHRNKFRKPTLKRYAGPRKWELVRDAMKENIALVRMTHTQVRAHLPAELRDVSPATIYKARDYMLRYRMTSQQSKGPGND